MSFHKLSRNLTGSYINTKFLLIKSWIPEISLENAKFPSGLSLNAISDEHKSFWTSGLQDEVNAFIPHSATAPKSLHASYTLNPTVNRSRADHRIYLKTLQTQSKQFFNLAFYTKEVGLTFTVYVSDHRAPPSQLTLHHEASTES